MKAPDYRRTSEWIALPGKNSPALLRPAGEPSARLNGIYAADLFFVHPTSNFGMEPGNADAHDPWSNQLTEALSLPYQAGAFNLCCCIYAPRYRQATIGSYFGYAAEGLAALDRAYDDISNAFEAFLKMRGDTGRPLFLAGHSQGAHHLLRLMAERVDPDPVLRQQLVAAYPVGFDIPIDFLERRLPHIPPCRTANDVGVVASWSAFGRGGLDATSGDQYAHRYGQGWKINGSKPVWCTNPLNWNDSEPASSELNLGALPISFEHNKLDLLERPKIRIKAGLPTLLPGVCGAEAMDGRLAIDHPLHPGFQKLRFGEHNYHNYDFALFYENIRQNVRVRLHRWFQKSENARPFCFA